MGTLSSELAPHIGKISAVPRVYVDANMPAGGVAYMRETLHWDVLFVMEHDDLRRARQIAPDLTFLVPGIGAQGGAVEETLAAGLDAGGGGLIVNASRSVIFADDPADEARRLRDAMRGGVP